MRLETRGSKKARKQNKKDPPFNTARSQGCTPLRRVAQPPLASVTCRDHKTPNAYGRHILALHCTQRTTLNLCRVRASCWWNLSSSMILRISALHSGCDILPWRRFTWQASSWICASVQCCITWIALIRTLDVVLAGRNVCDTSGFSILLVNDKYSNSR